MLVKFVASGANTLIGCFQAGDVARVSDRLAEHLVQVGVAAPAEQQPVPEPAVKTRKVRHARD